MRVPSFLRLLPILLGMIALQSAVAAEQPRVNTFSIVAFDPKTGDLGIAVQSRYFAVGSVVPWAKAGVGAIATQAYARVSFGPNGLGLLEQGKSADDVLEGLLSTDKQPGIRQVGIVDAKGRVAVHTGDKCNEWAGHHVGDHFVVQGNILAGPEVIKEMVSAYEDARAKENSELADWLMAALQAGQKAGGDRRGKQSAALLVVREGGGPGGDNDRYIDLRVDDHPEPIEELGRLLGLHNQFHPHLHPVQK